MINVENLNFDYSNKHALDDISFNLPAQSITALVGANGAGKTTLLRCLAALEIPTSGVVQIAGLDTQKQPRQCHQQLGYLSDFFGLYDELTVEQCLHHRCLLYGIEDVQQHIAETAKLTNLSTRLQDKAATLSRGLRQRLAIAQAIIHKPTLLLLDEPASGLDPEARHALSELFLLLRQRGMTIMVSSHILSELEDYCDHVLMLQDGKIAGQRQVGSDTKSVLLAVKVVSLTENLQSLLASYANVDAITMQEDGVHFRFTGDLNARQQLLLHLLAEGVEIYSFAEQQVKLQDVYMQLGANMDAGENI
ncbi:MAG: ABC transporter ATP-binding protein [Mariprofundales bacterium]